MLPLLVVNVLGALSFGSLYALAGLRRISHDLFLTALTLLFVLLTGLWVRAERQAGAGVPPFRRLGRVVLALAATVVGVPAAVLAPLGSLEGALPPALQGELHLPAVLVLLLASLALVALANLAGGLVAVGHGFARRGRRGPDRAGWRSPWTPPSR